MNRIRQLLRLDRQRRLAYFRNGKAEIAQCNLGMLLAVSAAACGSLLLFILITPLIISGWVVTVRHTIIFPATLLFCIYALLLRRRERLNCRLVTASCLVFQLVLLLLVGGVDLPPFTNVPATFIPFLYVALPCLFLIPFPAQYGLLLSYEAVYVFFILRYKSGLVAQQDILNSVVGLVISLIISRITLHLHVREYSVRTRYWEISRQDGLSGILNKSACISAMEACLQERMPATCTLLILDIDDFKTVNDSVGHLTGDTLLRTIGNVLTESFRATDIVGRFGGDEFVVLVRDAADRALMEEKCRLLQQRLRNATAAVCSFPVTCSIGGVLADNRRVSFNAMFQQADRAMYQAKSSGKDHFVLLSYQSAGTACCNFE